MEMIWCFIFRFRYEFKWI